jgi:hypothetical protein
MSLSEMSITFPHGTIVVNDGCPEEAAVRRQI